MTLNPKPKTAAFVFAWLPNGLIAAVTRRGDQNRVGLPGGKLDEQETARDAVLREADEEGWALFRVGAAPFHKNIIGGREILYFSALMAKKKSRYKEEEEIFQREITEEQYLQSPYGRASVLMSAYRFRAASMEFGQQLRKPNVKNHKRIIE